MAYSRTQWRESETALSADNMNNIEDGIQEALSKFNVLDSSTYRKTETYKKTDVYSRDESYSQAEVNSLINEKLNGKITVSNTEPSPAQGNNGDIWFVVI